MHSRLKRIYLVVDYESQNLHVNSSRSSFGNYCSVLRQKKRGQEWDREVDILRMEAGPEDLGAGELPVFPAVAHIGLGIYILLMCMRVEW